MHLNRLRMETVLCYTVQKDKYAQETIIMWIKPD